MTSISPKIRAGWAAALVLSLAACGGGGGSGGGSSTAAGGTSGTSGTSGTGGESPPPLAKLSGVAATGAAFSGAAITVVDQTGTTVCTTQTDSAGAYACTLPASTKAPLVIKATRDDQTFYSTTASAADGTANVTPLTTIIVAELSPDGNPASLAGAIQTNPGAVTADTIKKQTDELVAAITPLLSALGQAAIDPISGIFAADGTGQDKVLDSISVSVLPDGTAANIEITVKAAPAADGSAPLSISYSTSSTTTPVLPAVTASALANTPSPATVADLFARLTACYALPLSQRVNAPNDATAVTGGPADVIAPACRTLFVGDDPSTFYSNGATVGRTSTNQGAFNSLFRPGPTGLVWDRGNFEFVRANGDLVFSYRWTDTSGNSDNDTIIARNVNGTLKLAGNGYDYSAHVRPFSEHRDLINTPSFSSYTTGYNVNIDNKTDGSGNSIFSKVLVTAPDGIVRTFVPQSGLSYLVVMKDDGVTPSSSPIIRLAGAYQNTATAGNPADKELSLYFVGTQYADAQITALQNQSVWTLEFFDTSNASIATQKYRTLARAQSIAEIRQLAFVDATAAMRSELITETGANGYVIFGAPSQNDPNIVDFSANGNLDAWTVPQGALTPTSFAVYGRAPFGSTTSGQQGARFNDSTGVASSARKAVVFCSTQGSGDKHCDNTLGQQYAQGTTINTVELWARNSRQVEISKKIGLYKLQ
jgi:hypothetical protein